MSKELVERLRTPRVEAGRESPSGAVETLLDSMKEAADLIERQSKIIDGIVSAANAWNTHQSKSAFFALSEAIEEASSLSNKGKGDE